MGNGLIVSNNSHKPQMKTLMKNRWLCLFYIFLHHNYSCLFFKTLLLEGTLLVHTEFDSWKAQKLAYSHQRLNAKSSSSSLGNHTKYLTTAKYEEIQLELQGFLQALCLETDKKVKDSVSGSSIASVSWGRSPDSIRKAPFFLKVSLLQWVFSQGFIFL